MVYIGCDGGNGLPAVSSAQLAQARRLSRLRLYLPLQHAGENLHGDRFADYHADSGVGQHYHGGRFADIHADRLVWRSIYASGLLWNGRTPTELRAALPQSSTALSGTRWRQRRLSPLPPR